jgi:hypothetical protein
MTQPVWLELAETNTAPKRAKKSKSEANALLWKAVHALDAGAVREALEDGASADARIRTLGNQYPLMYALQRGALDIADVLAAAGADVRASFGSFAPVDMAFVEDRPEVLEWLYGKTGKQLFAGINMYKLGQCAEKGQLRCIEWLFKNHPKTFAHGSSVKDLGVAGNLVSILARLKNDRWSSEMVLHWAGLVQTHAPALTDRQCAAIWEESIRRDEVPALRLLLSAGFPPAPRSDGLPWVWEALWRNAAQTATWMTKAPSVVRELVDFAHAHPPRSTQALLSRKREVHQGVLEVLSGENLLPTLDELEDKTAYPDFYLHHFATSLSKTSAEWLARKWPAALQVQNAEGQDVFAIIAGSKRFAGNLPAIQAAAEKIMIRKVAGRAAPKSSFSVKRRL